MAIKDLLRHSHILGRVVHIGTVSMLFVLVLPMLVMPVALVKRYLPSTHG